MIVLITLLGLALRLVSINQSLWLDEATSVIVARDFSFNEILTKFSPGDFHPPFYYLILKSWISLVGSSEVAVRSLGVLFGLATILFIYILGKKLFSASVGTLAALLLATAPLHIYYSQEARMYSLETLLVCIVVYFFLEKRLFLLILSSAALLFTDYLPVFALISLFVYSLVYERKNLKHFIGWIIGTIVIFLPWLPTFLTQLHAGSLVKENAPLWWVTLGRTNLHELALVPVKFVIGRISSYDKVFYVASVSVAVLPFAFSVLESAIKFSKNKILWFWFLGPLILTAVMGYLFSGFSYFRLLFILPAFYLLVAYGATVIRNKQLSKAVIVCLVVVNLVASGIYLFNPRFYREDWRGAVSYIESNSHLDSSVIFVSKNQRDAYHYYAQEIPSFGPEGADLNFPQVWLMRYVQPIFDPKDEVRSKIESMGYQKTEEKDFNGVVVWRYVK